MVARTLRQLLDGRLPRPRQTQRRPRRAGIELAALALICKWDGREKPKRARRCRLDHRDAQALPRRRPRHRPLPDGRHRPPAAPPQPRQQRQPRLAPRRRRRPHAAPSTPTARPPPSSAPRRLRRRPQLASTPTVTGWTPDVGHIIRGGMDIIDTMTKWQHLVNHIHYKDFSGNGPEPWAQMGTAKLDFHKITEWLDPAKLRRLDHLRRRSRRRHHRPDGVTLQNGQWCTEQPRPASRLTFSKNPETPKRARPG